MEELALTKSQQEPNGAPNVGLGASGRAHPQVHSSGRRRRRRTYEDVQEVQGGQVGHRADPEHPHGGQLQHGKCILEIYSRLYLKFLFLTIFPTNLFEAFFKKL